MGDVKISILQMLSRVYIERKQNDGKGFSMNYDLQEVCGKFQLRGDYVIGMPFGTGHINDTNAVTFDQGGTLVRYIVQRINTNVFRQPEQLMENFERVTSHIRGKLRRERETNPATRRRTLELVPAKDGRPFVCDAAGNFFRCYVFVENARAYDVLETPEQAFKVAQAFGEFQCNLVDLPGPRLYETIPDFHNTPKRIAALEQAIAEDRVGRAAEVKPEIDFVFERREEAGKLLALVDEDAIPERITHNDTKISNILIDDLTGEGMCVIDLDTVMPGLSLYDFGDMVRAGTGSAEEDEVRLERVGMRFDMFEATLQGFLSSAGKFLNEAERENLPFSGKLITFETGVRFLTDYLNGDVYFKTSRPRQNLDRCRNQFQMVRSIEAQMDRMMKLL